MCVLTRVYRSSAYFDPEQLSYAWYLFIITLSLQNGENLSGPRRNFSFCISLKAAILRRLILQFYFHGLRIELKPCVVEGLMVSQLMERFQATQLAVIGFLETGQESFEFYLCKNSIVICYKSVTYFKNSKIIPSVQNFTRLFLMLSSEFRVAFLQTGQQLRQDVVRCYL